MKNLFLIFAGCVLALAQSCSVGETASASAQKAKPKATKQSAAMPMRAVPVFNADSAYSYVREQVAFGPRVPGSQASAACADWLEATLKRNGAVNITRQNASLTAYNGDKLDICNITAQLNPESTNRVLLLAHWDSRPWADHDPDKALRGKPIDGANDGASGVAVILEILRALHQANSTAGIDVLFVDAEDYGRRADIPYSDDNDDSWALGTQYWLQQPTLQLCDIRFAILLDMVGGINAVFNREMHSQYAARQIVDFVWSAAKEAGHASRFSDEVGAAIVDDHVYLLMNNIPAIDIIECANAATGSFNPTWHTHADNLDNIDRETLRAVGETVIKAIN